MTKEDASKAEGIWDRMAAGYDELALKQFETAYRLSCGKVCEQLHGTEAVLDIGCGTGIISLGIAHCAGHVTGTDTSQEMIATARRKAEEKGITNAVFRKAEGTSQPFKSESFDAVLLFNVIHFLEEPARLVEEAKRLVKPRGVIICASDCLAEPAPLLVRLKVGLQRVLSRVGILPFFWSFSREDLHAVFEGAGLTIDACADLHDAPVNHCILASKF